MSHPTHPVPINKALLTMDTNHSPFLSIIVPVYNVEKYLHECVDSILGQDFTDFELILVDDGSPDNCPAICDEYAEKDNRVIVIHKENGGLSSARNAGIDICKGEYIWFIDSDDYIREDCLQKMCIQLDKSDPDLLLFGYNQLNDRDRSIIRVDYRGDKVVTPIELISSGKYLDSACMYVSKAKIWLQNGLRFCEGIIHEDFEVFPRVVGYASRIEYLHHLETELNPYYYRIREGSIVRRNTLDHYSLQMHSTYEIQKNWDKLFGQVNTTYEDNFKSVVMQRLYPIISLLRINFTIKSILPLKQKIQKLALLQKEGDFKQRRKLNKYMTVTKRSMKEKVKSFINQSRTMATIASLVLDLSRRSSAKM